MAGFPGWYSLAYAVPFLGIVLLFFLDFSAWPALRQVANPDRKRE